MKNKIICIFLVLSTLICMLSSCVVEQQPKENDDAAFTSDKDITSDSKESDGANSVDDESDFSDSKESDEAVFVIGEEILFANGEEFLLPVNYTSDYYKVTSAKMVAMEEYTLDDPESWPYKDQYIFSYRYRIYVTGYCSTEQAGNKFGYTMRFRTAPYNGVEYLPRVNYESSIIREDGYFEFSVDVFMPDMVTKVIPTRFDTGLW